MHEGIFIAFDPLTNFIISKEVIHELHDGQLSMVRKHLFEM